MSVKNTLKKALGTITLAGVLAFSNLAMGAGQLRTINNSSDLNFNKDYIDFTQIDAGNGHHPVISSPKLNAYLDDGTTNKYNSISIGSNIDTQQTHKCALQYQGDPALFNGTNNYVGYRFNLAFSSNLVFTCKVEANGTNKIGDIRKKIIEGGGTWGRVYLDNTTNAFDGQIYGTNIINIAPIETTLKNVQKNPTNDALMRLEADVRPGTVAWVEKTDDLASGSWTNDASAPKYYVNVKESNFGGLEKVVWDVPASTNSNSRFWRIKNTVYANDTTNNIVDYL